MKRCNQITMDTQAVMADLIKAALAGLQEEAETLAAIMRREVDMTVEGDGPGKPGWRRDIARSIGVTATTITAERISVDVGVSADNEATLVRAMLVAYGSGENAEGDGAKIHAGPTGRQVWDDDLSAKRPSRAASEYELPDRFNQPGNRFVTNAMRMMQNRFGNGLTACFVTLPKGTFFKRVKVRGR